MAYIIYERRMEVFNAMNIIPGNQYCGRVSASFECRSDFPSVWRIRDVYPGSELSPSRILIKEFKSQKWFLSSKKYDPGCSSRIPDPDADFLPSRIQGSKRHPILDPGSATLLSILIQIRIWIGIKTMLIHMRILSQVIPGVH